MWSTSTHFHFLSSSSIFGGRWQVSSLLVVMIEVSRESSLFFGGMLERVLVPSMSILLCSEPSRTHYKLTTNSLPTHYCSLLLTTNSLPTHYQITTSNLRTFTLHTFYVCVAAFALCFHLREEVRCFEGSHFLFVLSSNACAADTPKNLILLKKNNS